MKSEATLLTAAPHLVAKSDLHLHLLLSAPFETYQNLSPTPIPPPVQKYASLPGFFQYLGSHFIPLFANLENVRLVVRSALQHLIADGIVYAEASIALTGPLRAGVSWREYAKVFREERAAVADRLLLRLELGHARELPVDWPPLLDQAIDTGLFWGVDLYGDELHGSTKDFSRFFEAARRNDLKIKLHTGEVCTASQMHADIAHVEPYAVQHGISAASSPALLKFLAASSIQVNICPASNIALGHSPSYEQHQIRSLVDAGVQVTLCSDDYAVFSVSVSEEYRRLHHAKTLTLLELERIRLTGLRAHR